MSQKTEPSSRFAPLPQIERSYVFGRVAAIEWISQGRYPVINQIGPSVMTDLPAQCR